LKKKGKVPVLGNDLSAFIGRRMRSQKVKKIDYEKRSEKEKQNRKKWANNGQAKKKNSMRKHKSTSVPKNSKLLSSNRRENQHTAKKGRCFAS